MENEMKKFKLFLFKTFVVILTMIILFFIQTLMINNEIFKLDRQPIDYELKNLDECYLTIHNFIRLPSWMIQNNSNDFDFKTYIYSYTKPYLIQLINNNTNDCIC